MLRNTLTLAAIALAAPALSQTAPDPAAPAAAPAAPTKTEVAAGAKVVDTQGADVGTIESVASGVATLSTGSHRAGIPITSFASGDGKLVLALTKAQVDAQGAPIAANAATAATTSGAATVAATAPATIAVGATVKDSTGAPVGTVKAVNGDLVTVASATASAQLSRKSFALSGDSLVIGLTAAQFESAAKAAGGAKKG